MVYHYAYYLNGEYKQVAVKANSKPQAITEARNIRPEANKVKTLWFCFGENEPRDAMVALRNWISKYGTDD